MRSVFMERALSGPKPVKVSGGTPVAPHIPRPVPSDKPFVAPMSVQELRRLVMDQ